MKKDQANCVFTKGVGGGNVLHSTPVVWGLMAFFALSFPVNSFAETSPVQATQTVQQQKTVKGSILDENGEPMIGVSVVVKGTTTGTVTDFDGNFSLSVPANTKTLEISYIGYKTQNVTIGNAPLSIKMQPDNKLLDEVVVIGYGTVKKRDLTGAVTSIKSEDITLNPGTSPMEALQGKVAGLDITKSSGQAGAGSSIQLRGTRSLQTDKDGNPTGGDPTYIIDGMPGDISTLNPNDIESIEILKDASSTAVYGSSGANGVIIVTTKQASSGKPVINFNAYTGFTKPGKTIKMRSGDSYLQVYKDANRVAGLSTELSDIFTDAPVLSAINNNQWVNWADEVLHTGTEQNYSFSVTGGTDKTKAYFSLNYSTEESLYKNDTYDVYSSRFRIDHEINKWITAGINAQASYSIKNARSGDVYETALFSRPLGVPYNEDGSINLTPVVGESTPSVLADEQPGVYKNETRQGKIYLDAYVDWKPIKGLSIRSQLGGNYSHYRRGTYYGANSFRLLNNGEEPQASTRNYMSYNYKWENILTYNLTLAEDHNFTFTGVTSYNHNRWENYEAGGKGIADDKLLWYGLSGGSSGISLDNSYEMSKGMGYVARLNYSYKGKYLASVSCRWDGSSRLASDNRWSNFPAMSLGWRVSDESFMEKTKGWLDNLKLRVGYGVSGSTAGISPYSSYAGIETGFMQIGGEKVNSTFFTQYIANKDLSWERSYNLNVGIDASFLNNRIDFTADYYNTKTKDVIIPTSMPNTMGGYNSNTLYIMNTNIGETSNRGFEFALTTRNIVKKDFTWTTNVTFSTNKEKIEKLNKAGEEAPIINAKNGNKAWKIGEAVDAFYQYQALGIWQYSERETAALFGCTPGDIKFSYPSVSKDADGYFYNDKKTGDKVYITAEKPYSLDLGGDDRSIIGKTTPDWTGGIKNSFTYKDFDFSFFIYARWGQMMKFDKVLGKYSQKGKYNIPEYFTYYDKTLEQDQDVLFYAIDANGQDNYPHADALSFVDGSFWKLKNVTLGYTLPKSICQKFGISKLRVYGTATNLFVFSPSKYVENYDPEMSGSVEFPLSKEFVFGINLTF